MLKHFKQNWIFSKQVWNYTERNFKIFRKDGCKKYCEFQTNSSEFVYSQGSSWKSGKNLKMSCLPYSEEKVREFEKNTLKEGMGSHPNF